MSKSISPVLVAAQDITVSFGEQAVLREATLSIHQADRIGLIGNNGSGKSTLIQIITGLMEPDAGSVSRKRELLIGYLPQAFLLDPALSVYDNIREGAHDVVDILREYEALPSESERRHLLEERIRQRDGWNLENRIAAAMHSLGVPDGVRDIATLSGGEKRRVALCRAIIARPDLLILDEPTNHLDTESIEWMEEFLSGYAGACLFVTHDRYFLDALANKIIELADGRCYTHRGSYTDFLLDKAERESQAEVEEHKRNRYLRRELEWVRRGPEARRKKSKSRMSRYFELAGEAGYAAEEDVDFVVPPPTPLGSKILNFKHLGLDLGGRRLIDDLDFQFTNRRKLGIIGRNGLGKTSLLRMILGELAPSAGRVELGDRTVVNYVDQSRVSLNDANTVIQEIGEGREWIMFGEEKMTVWRYLRRYLFADDRMNTRVEKLSGGERSRLLLAKILKNGGNLLILDEPTNDLDLATMRVLEETLIAFDGCVIAVSHDRYFLNRVCNGILAFEGDGVVHFSEGDYDYYIEKRAARRAAAAAAAAPARTDARPAAPERTGKRKLTWKESRELETIEVELLRAEGEVAKIEEIFSRADFYEAFGGQTARLTAELGEARLLVDRLYARWHELEAIRDGSS
jgi:ATP-binding cassette subfamily F protein uup